MSQAILSLTHYLRQTGNIQAHSYSMICNLCYRNIAEKVGGFEAARLMNRHLIDNHTESELAAALLLREGFEAQSERL